MCSGEGGGMVGRAEGCDGAEPFCGILVKR